MSLLDNLISGAANAAAQVAAMPAAVSLPATTAKPHPCPRCFGVLFYSHDPSGKPKKCAVCNPITQPGFRLWTLVIDDSGEPTVVEYWQARYLHVDDQTPSGDAEWWRSSPHNLYDKLRVRLPETTRVSRHPPPIVASKPDVGVPKKSKSKKTVAKSAVSAAGPSLFGSDSLLEGSDHP